MAASDETGEGYFQDFELGDDELYLTVGGLINGMKQADKNKVVLLSDDAEGNDFRPIDRVTEGLYLPKHTWSGMFWPHPDEHTTMDARMLYERLVLNNEDSVQATLVASIEPDASVETMMRWEDIEVKLNGIDPESKVVLGHHTRADKLDLAPSHSPLYEVEAAHYLPGGDITVNVDGFDASYPIERIKAYETHEDAQEQKRIEQALKNPDSRPAYFFWPIN